MNIWSHLLGFLAYFIVIIVYLCVLSSPYQRASNLNSEIGSFSKAADRNMVDVTEAMYYYESLAYLLIDKEFEQYEDSGRWSLDMPTFTKIEK